MYVMEWAHSKIIRTMLENRKKRVTITVLITVLLSNNGFRLDLRLFRVCNLK